MKQVIEFTVCFLAIIGRAACAPTDDYDSDESLEYDESVGLGLNIGLGGGFPWRGYGYRYPYYPGWLYPAYGPGVGVGVASEVLPVPAVPVSVSELDDERPVLASPGDYFGD